MNSLSYPFILDSTFTIIMTVITLKLYHHKGNSMSSSSTSLTRITDKLYKRKPKYEAEITESENHVTEKEATTITQHGPYRRLSYTLNIVCFYLSVAWNTSWINYSVHCCREILNIRKNVRVMYIPLSPTIILAKLGYARLYQFFLFLLQNIDCGYSQSMF